MYELPHFGALHFPVDGLRALRDLQTPIDPARPELGPRVNQVALMTNVNEGRDSLALRFIRQAYGSVNFVRHGSYCGGTYRFGSGAVFGDFKKMPHGRSDISNAEFILFIGTAPGNAGNPFKRTGALLAQARSDGKLDYVVVDPVLNNSDSMAIGKRGRWVPIRPGTDTALVMAMVRWMIENQRTNTAYLSIPNPRVAKAAGEPSHSNATWLVITEPGHLREGRLLRASDLGIAPAGTKAHSDADPHVVLDTDGHPIAAESATSPAQLEVDTRLTVGGKPQAVASGYRLLKAVAMQMEIAEYAAECGIPATTITALADTFTRHGRKASAMAHGGMMNGAGFYGAFGVITLNVLIGSINWKGGLAINGGSFKEGGQGPRYNLAGFPGQIKAHGTPLGRNMAYEKTTEFATKKAAGTPYPARGPWFPNAPGLATQWLTGAMEGYPYAFKALILWSSNPLYGLTGLRAQIEKDLADPGKLPLIIAVDPFINETVAFADYIVPDSMLYESWGWTAPWNGVPTKTSTARWPVVEPRMAKTVDGRPIGVETFFIDVARRIGLPGFGEAVIPDFEGKLHPLTRAEDWFLRGGANIAWQGETPVDEATGEDIALSGVERIRPALESVLKADEWRRVAMLYTRSGRFQDADQAQDANHPEWMAWRFKGTLQIYNEHLGSTRNSLSGTRYTGCASHHAPAFADGTPMRNLYTENAWPLQVVSFKSALQNSYSIATRITGIHPVNPLVVHPKDAAPLGLETGDSAWLSTPGGKVKTVVIVHPGVMRGVVAVEHGYGHRELGARAHLIGDRRQPERKALSAGINLNELGLSDPTMKGLSVWVDSVSGGTVRNGLPGKLERA